MLNVAPRLVFLVLYFSQEMEKKNLSERKCLVSEYNDLIESIKIEQKEEAEIQKVRHEEIQRDLQKKNEDLEEEKKESAEKNEDLVATLDESRIVLREKDQEIDILNEEIFKVPTYFSTLNLQYLGSKRCPLNHL